MWLLWFELFFCFFLLENEGDTIWGDRNLTSVLLENPTSS